MSGDYLSTWPLERARLDFHHMGRVIDAVAEVPGMGWVMLWHDENERGVSFTTETTAKTGGGYADAAAAIADFRKAVDVLLQGCAGPFGDPGKLPKLGT